MYVFACVCSGEGGEWRWEGRVKEERRFFSPYLDGEGLPGISQLVQQRVDL